MNVRELRIGNTLKVNDLIVYVCKIEYERFWCSFKDKLFFQGIEANPITLTEEILLKCGFKKFNEREEIIYSHVHREDFIDLLILNEKIIAKDKKDSFYYFLDIDTCQEDDYFKAISAPMQNLHTLQNYYPAFSGTELQINL